MKSILRYPGGKSRVQATIAKYLPHRYSEYREPFVGGGGVYFGILPTEVDRRWINDCHPDLIAVYQSLRDRPREFISRCRQIKSMVCGEEEVPTKKDGKRYNRRLGEKFQELLTNREDDPALSYFFINRTVWAGRVNYALPSRLYYSNPQGWNIVNSDKLDLAAHHIKGTKITCGDYGRLLMAVGSDVLIYCDPPYVVNTDMPKTDQQYEYNFTTEDHEAFVKQAKKCKHKLCISYDDCDLVREWFAGSKFKIHDEEWAYSGSSKSEKNIGKEVIITNY